MAFLFYELKYMYDQTSIIKIAEDEILQEIKKHIIVKVFD